MSAESEKSDVATAVEAKPAQVARAWLISLPDVVAIPRAASVEQFEFNVAEAEIQLSADSRRVVAAGRVALARSRPLRRPAIEEAQNR
jgi:aryl-alcohol dehydrogenase-like predicted oxidoreductase